VDATNRVFSPTDADLAIIQGSSGWFFAFPDTGEKGLSAPVTIADTVFLTSYLPEFSRIRARPTPARARRTTSTFSPRRRPTTGISPTPPARWGWVIARRFSARAFPPRWCPDR